MAYTDPFSSGSFGNAARGSATLAWANPNNATIGSPVATDVGFIPGRQSLYLAGSSFAPTIPIPDGSTILSDKLYIRHRVTTAGTAPTQVSLAAVLSNNYSGNPNHPVPLDFEDFAVDLTSAGYSVAQINAGTYVTIAYDATTDPKSYNASYWSFNADGSSGVPPRGPGPYPSTLYFDLVATYTGPLPAPAVLIVNVRSVISIAGPWNVPGYATLDNGQGTVTTGTINNPPTSGQPAPADSTVKYALPVSGGVATLTLPHTRTNTGTSGNAVDFSGGGVFPTVASPDASTMNVESVYRIVQYNGPTPPVSPNSRGSGVCRIPALRATTPSIR